MAFISGKKNFVGDRFPGIPNLRDRFWEIDANGFLKENWIYNDNFWIGKKRESSFNLVESSIASSVILSVDKTWDLFLNNLKLDYLVEGKNNASRYWKFNFYRVNSAFGLTLLKSGNTVLKNYDSLNLQLNLQDRLKLNDTLFYSLEITNYGNPGVLTLSGSIEYQPIKYN